MSAESDVLMQQFRQAVYERLATPGAGRGVSAESAIERRSVLFRNWQSGLQASGETEHLAADLVRHWAVADVTAFRNVRADRRAVAENDIFKNISASPAYAQILSSVDAKLFDQVKAAAAVNEQKIAERLGRDVRELEQVRRDRARLLDDTPEAQKHREELLPSDWNGKIVVETIKDPLGDLLDVRAERKGDAGSQHLAFVDTPEQAKALAARYEPIAKHWTVAREQPEAGFVAGDEPAHKPADPESVISKILENATYKTRSNGSVLYLINNRPAFVDHGEQILMEPKAHDDEEAILAAVLLAKEKYGGAFELTGTDKFKRRAIEIILKHDIVVKLKHPQQEALSREIAKEIEAARALAEKETPTATTRVEPLIGKPAHEDEQVQPGQQEQPKLEPTEAPGITGQPVKVRSTVLPEDASGDKHVAGPMTASQDKSSTTDGPKTAPMSQDLFEHLQLQARLEARTEQDRAILEAGMAKAAATLHKPSDPTPPQAPAEEEPSPEVRRRAMREWLGTKDGIDNALAAAAEANNSTSASATQFGALKDGVVFVDEHANVYSKTNATSAHVLGNALEAELATGLIEGRPANFAPGERVVVINTPAHVDEQSASPPAQGITTAWTPETAAAREAWRQAVQNWLKEPDGRNAVRTIVDRWVNLPPAPTVEYIDLPPGSVFADDLGDVLEKIDGMRSRVLHAVGGGPFEYWERPLVDIAFKYDDQLMVFELPEHLRTAPPLPEFTLRTEQQLIRDWLNTKEGREALDSAKFRMYEPQPRSGLSFSDMPQGTVFADVYGDVRQKLDDTWAVYLHVNVTQPSSYREGDVEQVQPDLEFDALRPFTQQQGDEFAPSADANNAGPEKRYWVSFADRYLTREQIEHMGEDFSKYEEADPAQTARDRELDDLEYLDSRLDSRRPALMEWLDSNDGRKALTDAVNVLYEDGPSPGIRFDDMPKGSVFADEFGNVLEKVGDTDARVLHDVECGTAYDDAGGVERMRAHSDETFQPLRLPKRLRLADTPDTRFADIPVTAIFQDGHGGLWEKNGPESAVLLRADRAGLSAGMEGNTGAWPSHAMVEVVVDSDLRPVRAIDWWTVQRAAIHSWAKTDSELKADLEQLGPEPSHNLVYWFDRSGTQRVGPSDQAAFVSTPDANAKTYWVDFAGRYMTRNQIEDLGEDFARYDTAESREPDVDVGAPPPADAPGFVAGADEELRARDAMGSDDSSADIAFNVNLKELDMAAVLENTGQDLKPVLRGVKKLDNGEYDTTVLLFKGKGDYLQGFVKVGDQKHQVIAHINARKPDDETGEVRPNFLKLAEPYRTGDNTKWKEIGFGNAVNRRQDNKPVYFDEVLFSVGTEVVQARVTKHVDADMHKQLGFVEPRKARPKDDQSATPAGDANPKATAPAAKEKGDAAGARNPARNAAASTPAAGENAAGTSKPRNPRQRARA